MVNAVADDGRVEGDARRRAELAEARRRGDPAEAGARIAVVQEAENLAPDVARVEDGRVYRVDDRPAAVAAEDLLPLERARRAPLRAVVLRAAVGDGRVRGVEREVDELRERQRRVERLEALAAVR
jgi:hypothetical protein